MSIKDGFLGYMTTHMHAPRHDFQMSENKGIEVPTGQTIVIASFLQSHGKNVSEIDVTKRDNAVWFTTPKEIEEQKYDFIIGPDGEASRIAIKWNHDKPEIFYMDKDLKMYKLEGTEEDKIGSEEGEVNIVNYPSGSTTVLLHKRYDIESLEKKQRETYTILRLPDNYRLNEQIDINSFAAKETLVSGMNNRGFGNRLSTGWWAISNADCATRFLSAVA